MSEYEMRTNARGRTYWRNGVTDEHDFYVREYDDDRFLVWFTNTEDGDVVMDRGGLRVMRDVIDMALMMTAEDGAT